MARRTSPVVAGPSDRAGRTPTSRAGLRAVAVVLTATAFPVLSLGWASGVARTEVERRATAGLAAISKATVLQEQQAWDDAVRVIQSAASRPVPLSALEVRDTTLASQGVQNILITGPFASVRLYSLLGDVVGAATLPDVTPTPVGTIAPGPLVVGEPTSVGTVTARQVSVAAGAGGRLIVDVDMTQLLGKPADLGFGRTGAKFLVTRQGLVVAGSAGVGEPLLAPRNLEIAAAGKAITATVYSPFFKQLRVESYEPITGQNVGILVQQSRSEVMAGADRLSALLRWVAIAVGVLGIAVAAFLGVLLGRRSRRLMASEQRLAESETASRRRADEVQFLSVITASMSEGVVVLRAADSTIAYANTSYETMFGFEPSALVGRSLEDLIVPEPDTPESPLDEMRRRLVEGGTWRGEIHALRKDGSDFWCALNVTTFDHPAFGPAWIAVNTDVTARKQAEEARASLAKIVQASSDAIFAKTVDGIVTSWNHGAEVVFGYTAGEMVGVAVDVLVPPDRMSEERDLRAQVGAGTSVEQKETVRLRKDGTPVDVSVTMSPIEDARGAITGIATICRDVTERNRAEAKFQGLLESAPDAIVVVGPDGLMRIVNRQTEVLFGYARQELLGRPVELLLPAGFAEHQPDVRAGFRAGDSPRPNGANLELTARRKDGREFPVDLSLAPLQTEEGLLVSAAIRDVTERMRAQAALLERETELALARDQALEASRLKSDFLANMSHEIRTPMNAVIGLTGLLLDSGLDTEQREYAGAVRSAGEALLDIINDLLDFSKIEAGKLRLEVMDFELATVVDEVADLLGSEAHEKRLRLRTSVDPDVPAWVRGDPGRLRQVLTNLVGNAIKFSDQGEIDLRVRIADLAGETANVRFEVADTGIGISAEGQAQLFQAFEQVDSSPSRRHGGTGLGLAISRQLVEMMGGEIGLESALGVGSTFWFSIPLAVAAQPKDTSAPLQGPAERTAHPGVRLLVAEDNPINQLVAVRMLEKLGYKADVAANGSEAIDALRRIDYAAVLMDCQMPEMDGFEATREIRRMQAPGRRTPVIAMTAAAAHEDRDRCFEADMDDYISKPVRGRDLAAVLSRWVHGDGVPDERVEMRPATVSGGRSAG